MEHVIHELAGKLALVVETAAVLITGWGALEALVRLIGVAARGGSHGVRKEIWRRLAGWLLLGLEFMLAGDIIRSVIAPTWADIGQLASIAAIRTFLNYFLEKDLEQSASSEAAAA
jgi:uncharacterized membrane protein